MYENETSHNNETALRAPSTHSLINLNTNEGIDHFEEIRSVMMDFDFSEIPSNILSMDGESFSETKDESKAHLEVDASTKSTTEFEIPPEFDPQFVYGT